MDVRAHFRVPGLGRRVSGSGLQVQVQVPGLIPEPAPAPVPAAETWHLRMCSHPPTANRQPRIPSAGRAEHPTRLALILQFCLNAHESERVLVARVGLPRGRSDAASSYWVRQFPIHFFLGGLSSVCQINKGLGFLGRKGGRRLGVTAFFVFAPAN